MSIKWKPPDADIEKYDLFMATLYGDDDEAWELEICGEARALMHKRQPQRVRVRKGQGTGHFSRYFNRYRPTLLIKEFIAFLVF